MFGFTLRRGRQAAVRALRPLVEGSRLRLVEIPESAWLDPYIIGFLGMLITIEAERETGPLGMSAMAQLQSAAWADITGQTSDLVGEEICFLSAAGNKAFGAGCRNAAAFFEALNGRPVAGRLDSSAWLHDYVSDEGDGSCRAEYGAGPAELWSLYFDDHISRDR